MITQRLLRFVWLAMLVCVVAGELLPRTSAPLRMLDELNVNDKAAHLLAYAVLMALPALHEARLVSASLAIAVAGLGALLELGQRAMGRSFEVSDIAANIAGVLCGVAAGSLARLRWGTALDWRSSGPAANAVEGGESL